MSPNAVMSSCSCGESWTEESRTAAREQYRLHMEVAVFGAVRDKREPAPPPARVRPPRPAKPKSAGPESSSKRAVDQGDPLPLHVMARRPGGPASPRGTR